MNISPFNKKKRAFVQKNLQAVKDLNILFEKEGFVAASHEIVDKARKDLHYHKATKSADIMLALLRSLKTFKPLVLL